MANTIQYGRRSITVIPDGSTDFNLGTIQSPMLPMNTVVGAFTVGETVTQAVSGATGVVLAWDSRSKNLWLSAMTGTFDITNTVTGGTSSATAIPTVVAYAFPDGMRLSDVRLKGASGDKLVVRDRVATGPIVFAFDDDGDGKKQTVGGRSIRTVPYVTNADCTWASAAAVRIILEFD